jgi:hypothetical protein
LLWHGADARGNSQQFKSSFCGGLLQVNRLIPRYRPDSPIEEPQRADRPSSKGKGYAIDSVQSTHVNASTPGALAAHDSKDDDAELEAALAESRRIQTQPHFILVQEVGESSQGVAGSNISQNPRILFATKKSFTQDGGDDELLLQMDNMKTGMDETGIYGRNLDLGEAGIPFSELLIALSPPTTTLIFLSTCY